MPRISLPALLLLFVLSLALPSVLLAADEPNAAYVELAGSENPDFAGIQGGFAHYKKHVGLLAGFSLMGSSTFDNLFAGINLGARFHPVHPFRFSATPFIGLGGFAGYAKEKVTAENDGMDNDEDGTVDEEGETKDSISDTLATAYPEVGIHFNLMGEGLLTISARYNVTSKGRDFDHWMYTLGFTVPFSLHAR